MITRDVSLECELQNSLQRFRTLEEVLASTKRLLLDDEAYEAKFRDTHSRDSDGHYVVRLPLKSCLPAVAGETRRMALGSLKNLNRRFSREPRSASSYRDFLRAYEELGHMERISVTEIKNP